MLGQSVTKDKNDQESKSGQGTLKNPLPLKQHLFKTEGYGGVL
jgi:hypothetical protein